MNRLPASDRTEYTVNCDIIIAVCWQDWTDIREETAVAMKKGCHDVGLRKSALEN
jgi:hypothetical protein